MSREAEGAFLSDLLRYARAAIVVCGPDGRIRFATPHARRLLGHESVGQELTLLVDADSGARLGVQLGRLGSDGPAESVFFDVRTAGDPPRALEIEANGLLGVPSVAGIVLVLNDVTQHHERAAALEHKATHDPLTGLANHLIFHDRLRQLARGERPGQLAMIDLDHFKRTNDVHGHAAGDEVLVEIARRMRVLLGGASGTVARLGGEEFGVLLPGLSSAEGAAVVERVLAAIAEPQAVGVVTASAGMAAIPQAGGTGSASAPLGRVLRHADVALYEAKRAGRARLVVFREELVAARRAEAEALDALRNENVELSRLAGTDELTGIPNRRRFREDLSRVAAAAERRGAPYAVVFIDLDHFGAINKARGEIAGDQTLRDAAHALAGAMRAGDTLYRYGGEEFVALLVDSPREGALRVCERMRRTLVGRGLAHPTHGRLTASIGVASSADHDGEPSAAVAAAVAGMRNAKARGRNRVVAAW